MLASGDKITGASGSAELKSGHEEEQGLLATAAALMQRQLAEVRRGKMTHPQESIGVLAVGNDAVAALRASHPGSFHFGKHAAPASLGSRSKLDQLVMNLWTVCVDDPAEGSSGSTRRKIST